MGRLKKVYAYQIKENKKYKGRYIILIKQPEIEEGGFRNLYKVKLTNNMKLPKTVEEINLCEFVKMQACPYELRMFPIMGGLNYDEALQNIKILLYQIVIIIYSNMTMILYLLGKKRNLL